MNEAEAKFIWFMLNEAGGRRNQPCFHYAEREDFGGRVADSTMKNEEYNYHPLLSLSPSFIFYFLPFTSIRL